MTSIYFHIRRVAASDIRRIRGDARFATLYAKASRGMEFGDAGPSGPEIQASLDGIKADPALRAGLETMLHGAHKMNPAIPADVDVYINDASAFAADLRRPEPADLFYLDKSWHVLHYAFTGQPDIGAPPAGTLLAGEKVGEEIV